MDKWVNRRLYQKGLVRGAGGELSRRRADGAEPSEGNVGEPSPPHATAVVGDFKCTSLMVIQTASWKEKVKMIFFNHKLKALLVLNYAFSKIVPFLEAIWKFKFSLELLLISFHIL